MIDRLRKIISVSQHDTMSHLKSQRMMVIAPLVIFLLCASCWGFADSRIVPSGLIANTPADVLFLSSTAVVFICTLSVVLLGFDSISKRRLTGELAIDLSQPMERVDYAFSQILGVWLAAMLPTSLGLLIGIVLIEQQMGMWASMGDICILFISTGLLLWWYTSLQLIASSLARDIGSSVTIGVGTWIFFVFLWLIPTLIAAQSMGVDITDTTSVTFDRVQEKVDMFSPNGVYQILMETRLSDSMKPQISVGWLTLSTVLWTIVPTYLFTRRISILRP